VKEAELLVEKGQLGTGMRVLTDESAVAKMSDATLESLISKHPSGTPLPFGTGPGPACGRPPTKDDVKRILDLTDSDSAPGISGWIFAHVEDCRQVADGSRVSDDPDKQHQRRYSSGGGDAMLVTPYDS